MAESEHLTLEEITEHLADSVFEEGSELSEEKQRHLIECELCGERAKVYSDFVNKLLARMIQEVRRSEKELKRAGHLTDSEIELFWLMAEIEADRDEELIQLVNSHLHECTWCKERVAEKLAEIAIESVAELHGLEDKKN